MKKLKNFEDYNSNHLNEDMVGDLAKSALNFILAPITLPSFINMNTKFKIQVIEKAIEKYLNQKAEYEVLDEARYDIEMPSQLRKITERRNELSKMIKKYPTLSDYKNGFCKWLKKWNVINFRNKIDIDYICQKIMEMGPEDEKLYVNKMKSGLKFDVDKGKVVEYGVGTMRLQSRLQDRLNALRREAEQREED